MPKPIIIDLFGGVGGAARGYQQAGFHVVSVDIAPQPDSCADEFVQADLSSLDPGGPIRVWDRLVELADAWHASPPCQASSALTKGTNFGRSYPQMIPATRRFLAMTGKPWVIENVAGAPIRKDLMLCGEMFGLGVIRHRFFECDGFKVPTIAHVPHRGRVAGMRHGQWFTGPYFAVYGEGGGKGTVKEWRDAMGIDWTWERKSIAEAIPPAYTQCIGTSIFTHLRGRS